MSKLISNLEKGDKLYFFYCDKIHEYTVESTEQITRRKYYGSFNKEGEELLFEIRFKDCPTLTLYSGQWFSDIAFTNVYTNKSYILGIYATSIDRIAEELEKRYENAVYEKERAIKSADEAITRAKEQLENFRAIV